MACRLIAVGTVTGDCSSWVSGEVDLGEISANAPIPSQRVRNSPATGCPAGYALYGQGVQMGSISGYGNATYENVTWQSVPALIKRGDCTPTSPKYDCINGACTPKTTYNTPGIYSSLADCESSCGRNSCNDPNICIDPANYCPPGKVCISISDWSKIENLAGQIKDRSCS